MIKITRFDFISILISIVISPLIFIKYNSYGINQVSSNMQIFNDTQYQQVKSNIAFFSKFDSKTNTFQPEILLPGYYSGNNSISVDRLQFVYLQNELLYGQRYSTPIQQSIYLGQQQLFTETKVAQESSFSQKYNINSVHSNVYGKIVYMESNDLMVYGITDEYGLFIQNEQQTLLSTQILQKEVLSFTENSFINKIHTSKIHLQNNSLYVTIAGNNDTFIGIFSANVNINGTIQWQQTQLIPIQQLVSTKQDSLIRILAGGSSQNQFFLLEQVLKHQNLSKHGQSYLISVQDNLLAWKSKHFIQILNSTTGEILANFATFPGLSIQSSQGYPGINIIFLSDQSLIEKTTKKDYFDLISLQYIGNNLDDLKISKQYQQTLSTKNQITDKQKTQQIEDYQPTLYPISQPMTFNLNEIEYILFLAPNGVLYCNNKVTGQIYWRTQLNESNYGSKNTHISILNITIQQKIILISINNKIKLLDPISGRLKAYWTIPEVVDLQDSSDICYYENIAISRFQVFTLQLHPILKKQTLFFIRNGYLDALQPQDITISLSQFWERAGMVTFLSLVISLGFRVRAEQQKID